MKARRRQRHFRFALPTINALLAQHSREPSYMTLLTRRSWVPEVCESYVQELAQRTAALPSRDIAERIDDLVERNRAIHERECFNLNPATNVMNPRAEAVLAAGLGSRPSLGYPGDKYEMGLEAIEEIEVIAAALAAEVFRARHAEIRVASGALANLYGFMATCRPGDAIIAPPAAIGGHRSEEHTSELPSLMRISYAV